tara:strand:+ start:488 stop:1579 length:1092 start_codon:yes stop_codon:yes gene_type:complete
MKYTEINNKIDSVDMENPYSLDSETKSSFLLEMLSNISTYHEKNSPGYKNFLKVFKEKENFKNLEDIPPLPVRAFKMHDLYSVDSKSIIKTLTSSGTTGQKVSKIYLDKNTARRQSKALTNITKDFIGKSRMPMIIIDSSDVIKDRTKLNARAAGILGYSIFGRDHFYCLDNDLRLLLADLKEYIRKHENKPILVFGFTYIVWQAIQSIKDEKNRIKFPEGSILIHGGGWKKLADQNISNKIFKSEISKNLNIKKIYNYYGMVEQVGSIFMECEEGYLHCPNYADIIIRNPENLEKLDNNIEGVIQVLSILPVSYPGHSLLTEDLGTIIGEDDCACGRKGKYFQVSGRMPMAELRGCSDTRKT